MMIGQVVDHGAYAARRLTLLLVDDMDRHWRRGKKP